MNGILGTQRLASLASKSSNHLSVPSVSPLRACGRPPSIGGCRGYWTIPGGIALADSKREKTSDKRCLVRGGGMCAGIRVN